MNILILTLGTRGDVQPYVALGAGLQAAGHTVTLATAQPFAQFVSERGLTFFPVRGKYLELLQTSQGKAAVAGKGNRLALLRTVMPMLRALLDDVWLAANSAGFDMVIYHPKSLGGHAIAEKLGIPGILAMPAPLYSPTRAYPSPILPVGNLGGMLNRLSHPLMVSLASLSTRGLVNRWRKDALGLPPAGDELVLHGRPLPRLYGYSPAVVPTPSDWDEYSLASGYWFLDRLPDWRPSEALVAFLQSGPPPVYVGFGSMPAEDAATKATIVVEALARAGQRGVLAAGWGGLAASDVPASVHVLDDAPHDWLFPRMAAVVHHGGAGTTGAGLRAGVPTLVCPFFGDQHFWGRRVAALGVGPDPIPQKQLTAERLAGAIQILTGDPAMRQRAAALGETIRAEDGIGRAVTWIEAQVSRPPASAKVARS